MRTMTVAAGAIAMLLAGCAAETPLIDRILVMEGAFDPLTCKEVVARYNEAKARMAALEKLMEKSNSAIVNAIAYDTEYASARANKRFAQSAAEKKNCELPDRAATAQVLPLPPPPATAQAEPKKPEN